MTTTTHSHKAWTDQGGHVKHAGSSMNKKAEDGVILCRDGALQGRCVRATPLLVSREHVLAQSQQVLR